MTGLVVLQYGMGKIRKFPVVPIFAAVTPSSFYGVAGLLELVLGAIVLMGSCARRAAFSHAALMHFAYS